MSNEETTLHDLKIELHHAMDRLQHFESTLEDHDARLKNGINQRLHDISTAKQDKIPWFKVFGWATGFILPVVLFAFYSGVELASIRSGLEALKSSVEAGTRDRIYGQTANVIHSAQDARLQALERELSKHMDIPYHGEAGRRLESLKSHIKNHDGKHK